MNRIEIESNHWVERYLAGHLSEAEAQKFEAHWIAHPELVRDLENCARIKTGLAALRNRGELGALLHSSWWPGRLRLLTLAASVAVVAVGAALWSGARGTAGVALGAAAAALPTLEGTVLQLGSRHTIMRLRSAAPIDSSIELPDAPRALELRILPEVSLVAPATGGGTIGPQQYSAWMMHEDEHGSVHAVGRVDGLATGTDGFISVFVDSRTLRPGRYRLQLKPANAGADAGGQGFVIDVRGHTTAP